MIKFSIRGENLEVTDALRTYVEEKVAKKEGGIFTYKGYVKDENAAKETKEEVKEAASKLNF